MYLLEFHPHLWTSVANSSNFSETKYLQRLKPVYYEFLLVRFVFQPNPENNHVVSNMDVNGFENHLIMARGLVRRGVETFEFHNITSNAAPAPRFNNSSTNISELIAWIMKSNGARWLTIPQFVRQCIHLYNYQIQQMKADYIRFQELALTSIGYSIMWTHSLEFEKINVPTFSLVNPEMMHNMTEQRTYLISTVTRDKEYGDTHEAQLFWRHHDQDTTFPSASLFPFEFKCELHVLYCDSMKCPCVCINLLLEHFWKKHRKQLSEESFQYLPTSVQK